MPSCLLIVDVQKGFAEGSAEDIPAKVEALQANYDTVVVTRFLNPPGSPWREFMNWGRFAPESKETGLAFTPRPDALLIDKAAYTCVSPDFLAWLRSAGIHTVEICGIDTDICVTKCAVDLFENGIRPVVLKDFCASHAGAEAHERGLKTLARYIGSEQIKE